MALSGPGGDAQEAAMLLGRKRGVVQAKAVPVLAGRESVLKMRFEVFGRDSHAVVAGGDLDGTVH